MDYELVLVDDGIKEDCSKNEDVAKTLLCLSTDHGLDVKYIKNDRKLGLAVSRNVASDAASGDIIIKIDDDHFCDSNFVKELKNSYDPSAKTGCVGAVFPLIKDGIHLTNQNFELLGDFNNDEGWENRQLVCYPAWHKTLVPALTVRGIMAYKKVPDIRHREDLTFVSHREDTIFSMEYVNKGYQNFINTKAIAYHLYAGVGGCRSFSSGDANVQRRKDELIFQAYVRENWESNDE
jgi:glycosyltransferase involved in cell wall biosynthesis